MIIITVWNAWLLLWIMPLLFFIAGASAFLSLQSRLLNRFLRERVRRLLAHCSLAFWSWCHPRFIPTLGSACSMS